MNSNWKTRFGDLPRDRIVASSDLSRRLIWGRKYEGQERDNNACRTSSIRPQKKAGIWSSRERYEFYARVIINIKKRKFTLTRSQAQKKIALNA